jgi:hypothetical protein
LPQSWGRAFPPSNTMRVARAGYRRSLKGCAARSARRRQASPRATWGSALNRIATPPRACRWLHEGISEHDTIRSVLHPRAGDSRLTNGVSARSRAGSTSSRQARCGGSPSSFSAIRRLQQHPPQRSCLGSEVFLHKLIEFTGLEQKIVLFARTGFRLNSVKRSAHMRHLQRRGDHTASIVSCPRIFPGVLFLTEILHVQHTEFEPARSAASISCQCRLRNLPWPLRSRHRSLC